MSCHILVCVCV
ncbi:hypothetical protein BsWGS_14490 [Bradybaena similaris]